MAPEGGLICKNNFLGGSLFKGGAYLRICDMMISVYLICVYCCKVQVKHRISMYIDRLIAMTAYNKKIVCTCKLFPKLQMS